LETAADCDAGGVRRPRSSVAPLRILWSGRLQPWKGLPLLLRALATLPADCCWELRVMGQGPCLQRWQRLARKLQLDRCIEWVGWPEYHLQLTHYQWADVFAFTSLRDTSGTGLLEALAAGAPIIGLNHQGAADVMTDRCAIAVDTAGPAAAIAGFGGAITELASDAAKLQALSRGAVERAAQLSWDRQWDLMRSVYEHVAPRPATAPLAMDEAPSETALQASCLIEA
jgi:glycosyltransferase involved in cell wall biosynthesis